jgi:hypothetical protein
LIQSNLQDLIRELESYKENLKFLNEESIIPKNTKITCKLEGSEKSKSLNLVINTSNNASIRCAAIFAEGLFDEESLVV